MSRNENLNKFEVSRIPLPGWEPPYSRGRDWRVIFALFLQELMSKLLGHTELHRPMVINKLPIWLMGGAIALNLMGCESLNQVLPNLPLPSSFPTQLPTASSASPSPDSQSATVQSPAIAEMEATVRQRINEIRQEQGLKPLQSNDRLAQVARDYSRLMAEKNFFSHTGPDGRNVGQRVQAAGIIYWIVGENLFKSVNIPNPGPVAVKGWMESPGHRENILTAPYSETGVGVWQQGDSYYFTQLFLRPPSLPALFE